MALMDAPQYDPRRDKMMVRLMIGITVLVVVCFVVGFGGYVAGHGWFFSNLPAEHKVDHFFTALEQKDYDKAYGIYENDANWKQHPDQLDYKEKRFIEDWTTYSPVNAPITSHHVDVSRTDGSGIFGTGIVVGARVNCSQKIFLYVNRKDGTLAESPHVLEYNSKPYCK